MDVGLFDNLTGLLGGGQDGGGAMQLLRSLQSGDGAGPSGNVVSSLLGSNDAQAQDQTEGEAPGGSGQAGLAGMLETLAANGLGEHVASWLSDNPNLPINAQQIHDALGSDQVRQLAQSSGLPVGDFLQQLAQHLPAAASEAAGTDAA